MQAISATAVLVTTMSARLVHGRNTSQTQESKRKKKNRTIHPILFFDLFKYSDILFTCKNATLF